MDSPRASRVFTLREAQALLPTVRRVTADAVRRAEAVVVELGKRSEDDPDHARLSDELSEIVGAWAGRMQALDVEVKGLWLVDFDTGEGYYCWRYPEASVGHYHGYTDGFAGRMKIL